MYNKFVTTNYTKGLKLLMKNIIPQNNKRYLPHELKTRENAVITYRNSQDIAYVCRKYHISRISLWRWNKKYDGTIESIKEHLSGNTCALRKYRATL